jgi:hypothetical protein
MVTDLPDYEKKVVVVTIPGEYPSLVEVDVVKVDGVAIATPTVVGCLPVSIEHTVGINHLQIKGVTLKDPTFPNCIPTSIENEAIAYDSVNDRFKVDIEAMIALPAGTNAIGKLAANSGVDIGDVDVLSLPATVIAGMTTLPSGTNAIGKLAANNGVDIGDVDVKSLPATVLAGMTTLPAGTNAIGKLAANNGVDIGDVDVKSIAVGDNNIGNVDVVTLPTILQSTKHDSKTYKTAVFDASASGNLVGAVADKVIKLHALTIQAQNTVVVNLNNGSGGASLMEWSFQAREGAVIPMATAPAYWAITGVNTALYVTLSAAVTVTITAIYSDDDAT